MNEMKPHTEQEEFGVDLRKLFGYYLHHWKALVGSVVLVAFAMIVFTFCFVTPMYQASVTLYVNNSMGQQTVTEVNSQSLATAQRLVNTYVNIIKSNAVLSDVVKKGNLDCTPGYIRENMTAQQIQNTEMFYVTILHEDPEMAAQIANTIAEVAPSKISEFVEGSSTKIVDRAVVPQSTYSPSYVKNALLGGIFGGILMGVLLTLQYLFDMRLKDEDDINSYFSAPVLGSIPEIEDNAGKAGEDK